MRILVLGAGGMLGSRLTRDLGARHEVVAASRRGEGHLALPDLSRQTIHRLVHRSEPECVINAVGQVPSGAANELPSIWEANADFPHRLADICVGSGTRLIHLSTDQVFSGRRGGYSELDRPDPADLFGRSKLAGEVSGPGVLTLRVACIGLRPPPGRGFIEHFVTLQGTVRAQTRAVFSGLTVGELSRAVHRAVQAAPGIDGVFHVAGAPISEYTLFVKLQQRLGVPIRIQPDAAIVTDHTLLSLPFRLRFGYQPPSWDAMLDELAEEVLGLREPSSAGAL